MAGTESASKKEKEFPQEGKKSLRDALMSSCVIFDGAMGTELYRRHVFMNRCFDELNLSNPALIQDIHTKYLEARAEVLTTNTFGANPLALEKYGLLEKTEEINEAGVKLAQNAITEFCKRPGNEDKQFWIAGGIGPVGSDLGGALSKDAIINAILRQSRSLWQAGVDFIMFESQRSIRAIEYCIKAIKKLRDEQGSEIPFMVLVSLDLNKETMAGESFSRVITHFQQPRFRDKMPVPFSWGLSCGVGPDGMLESVEQALAVLDPSIPLVVQPNAGMPKMVENRNIYLTSPEYFTTYAIRYVNLGARGVGGCCGIHAEHIQEMAKAVKPLVSARTKRVDLKPTKEEVKCLPETPLDERSRFAWRLTQKRWVTSVELTPPRGYDLGPTIERCKRLHRHGIDCVNIPDGPRASSRISSLITADRIQKEALIEVILHVCCRDKNLIGLQADMLASAACDIRNLLYVTGDPPKVGEYPDVSGVFDTDSVGAVMIQKRLNQGIDMGGQSIHSVTNAVIGVGLDPTALDMEREVDRFFKKVEAGANFAITQPVFDTDALLKILDRVRVCNVPILAGIWPLASFRNASFLQNEVPGVEIPHEIMRRMELAETKEAQLAEGVKIACESIEVIRKDVAGIQVSAPFGNVDAVLKVLDGYRD
ncbi:MAG: bifunctional homocysteine S-methyltransferase/methylenetetrahydrofolate reductase [Planctomycetia bacterium]|nr:bifunctional homocysteine S-methyltransferase/methylenetetrahydrofolate reductase [Planctomycetia bacterium]